MSTSAQRMRRKRHRVYVRQQILLKRHLVETSVCVNARHLTSIEAYCQHHGFDVSEFLGRALGPALASLGEAAAHDLELLLEDLKADLLTRLEPSA